MQRVFRSSLIGLLGIASLTACGDKVPTGNTADVTAVTVTPATVPLNVGDKITLVATVTAGAGVTDRTVTWSSSNAAVATVNATTGEVTAVSGGTTTIIATSVANPAIKGAAAVTVGALVQPTVTIASLTQKNISADLSNIAGQLDVVLNVDAGTQKVSKVELLVNCGGADTVVYVQNVNLGDIAPLAAEASASTIQASFNTAQFNPANGSVAFKNGPCTLKARATTSSGTIVASSGTAFTINNANFIAATMTTPTTATGGTGLVWNGGAVTVTAIPVFYSAGATIASATVTLVNADSTNAATKGTFGNVAALGTVATLGNLTPTAGVITAAFPKDMSAAGVDSTTVKSLGVQVTTVTSAGNPGPTLNSTPANVIRLDNRGPNITSVPPTINLNVQNAQNGWLGSTFVFKSTGSGKSIIVDTSTTNDLAGVDAVKIVTQARPAGSGSYATFTSVSGLAETSSATAYDLRLQFCDALNNCATKDFTAAFGVDLTAPTLTQSGGVKDGDVFNSATGAPTTADFAVFDPVGAGGVSGSGTGANGLLVKDQALEPLNPGSKTACPIGVIAGSGNSITCSAGQLEPNSIDLVTPGAAVDGEYTMTVSAVDQAGNTSAPVTIKYYVDLTAPTIPSQGVSIPNPITSGTAFSGFTATDNMDVKAGYGSLSYPAGSFAQSGTASPAGATFDNVLTQSTTVGATLSQFYRSLTTAVGTVGSLPTSLNVNVIDAAGNLSSSALVVALPVPNLAAAGPALNTGANAITAFSIDSTKPSPATADPGKPITLYVNATPSTNLSGNPLQQVCFFYQVVSNNQFGSGAAAGDYVKIGCTPGQGTVGVAATRRFFYSFPWTPSSAFINSGPMTVVAVGNTAANDAIISNSVIVTVNPTPP